MPLPAPAANFEWALRAGGEGHDKLRGAAAASDGAVFVTGEFSGSADFGDHVLRSQGQLDFVVAKISHAGDILWSARAGGDRIDRGYAVSPAPDGGCFVTGHFQSATIQFGSITLTNAGDYDGFVARYDSRGNPAWALRFGGEKYDYGHGIATLPDGSAVLAGAIAGQGTLARETVGATSGRSALVARLTADGALNWLRAPQAPSASGHNVAVGPDGSIYLCGYAKGKTTWPDQTASVARLQDVFLAKFDQRGRLLWRRDTGGASDGLATSVAVDHLTGNVCIAGMFKNQAQFGAATFKSRGQHDFYLAVYAPGGDLLNVHHGGGEETDYALGATALPQGGFAITGEISTAGYFNGRAFTCVGGRDAFVAILDPHGAVDSFELAGGAGNDLSYAIAPSGDDALVIAGAYRNATRFGDTTLPAGKGNDIFLAKSALRDSVFLLPYFLGNGETGVYLTWSRDGFKFDWLNLGKPVLPAPQWPGENLTRDPSILYHDGVFHMVWTTSWASRSIGYASSQDLLHWSQPRKIDIWSDREDVRNTWAPELHWDPGKNEFFILWSTTTLTELNDTDGSIDPHGHDHRAYAARTRDFQTFTRPRLFYSPKDPEYGVIDPYIAHDPENNRWVMVIKNEMAEKDGGKNLRLTFSDSGMQGTYRTTLGPPIVGAGTDIVNQMGEGPSLLRHNGEWRLYWDAPGSEFSYCLATSPDLATWTNRSQELKLPAKQMRHGTVVKVPGRALRRP